MKVSYLGPRGTFSEEAALLLAPKAELVAYPSFSDCLSAVSSSSVDEAVIPLENSIEGVVNNVVDELLFKQSFYIHEMLQLPIAQNLIVQPGTRLEDIKIVISHPHAIPQCFNFLNSKLKGVQRETASSTGRAVEMVAQGEKCMAAIGNKRAAQLYGLEILYPAIQDNKTNFTQFVRISKKESFDYDNADSVTVAFSAKHEPGALFRVLEIFSVLDVNLSKIYSRPIKDRPNEYIFVIDMQINGNVDDIKEAVSLLDRKTDMVKILGVYKITIPNK